MDFFSLCFDADGSIPLQKRLASKLDEIINLRSEEKYLRLWAKRKTLTILRKSLELLRKRHEEPWLSFLGSGDFHHLALLLLETLPETAHPVTLVLIDNHPDWYTHWPQYHCGNWVSGVLRLPWIKSVVMVGQDSPDLAGQHFWGVPFQELCEGRVQLYPYGKKLIRVPFRWPSKVLGAASAVRRFYGTDLYFNTVSAQGAENFFDRLAERLKGQNLYLSIDKDCLEPQAAITDWEQGKLSLNELTGGVKKLMKAANVVGADICGERAPYRLQGLLKRIDAGRLVVKPFALSQANDLNEHTNLSLFEAFSSKLVKQLS